VAEVYIGLRAAKGLTRINRNWGIGELRNCETQNKRQEEKKEVDYLLWVKYNN
jgi:hypothetical protein